MDERIHGNFGAAKAGSGKAAHRHLGALKKKQQVKMKLDAFSNKARWEKYDLRLEVLKDSPEVQAKEIAEALKVLNKESEIMTPEKRVKEWMDFASKRQERVVNIVATRQL